MLLDLLIIILKSYTCVYIYIYIYIYIFVMMTFQCKYYYSGHYPSSCLTFKSQFKFMSLSVPHRKHIASPLRAQQVNPIYRFVTMVYYCNYYNSAYYPSPCVLFKTQLKSVGLPVPQRKYITSRIRAQQVNAIYRFMTMVY
jgi:hypothetical protein